MKVEKKIGKLFSNPVWMKPRSKWTVFDVFSLGMSIISTALTIWWWNDFCKGVRDFNR